MKGTLNMKILSISTSSNVASVSISENNECILELNVNNNKTHSETLIPLINTLFNKLNLNLSDINLIACDVGPGSFTGIRIGIASVKAMAESLNIPVIAVSSLEALVYSVQNNKSNYICSLIDAKNNQVYAGIFNSNYELLENYMADNINNIVKIAQKYDNIEFIGDGALAHKDLLKIKKPTHDYTIHAENIAKCAYKKFKNNNIQTADSLMPLYLKESQAERMKKLNA